MTVPRAMRTKEYKEKLQVRHLNCLLKTFKYKYGQKFSKKRLKSWFFVMPFTLVTFLLSAMVEKDVHIQNSYLIIHQTPAPFMKCMTVNA